MRAGSRLNKPVPKPMKPNTMPLTAAA